MTTAPTRYQIQVEGYQPFACASDQRVLVAMEQAFPIPLPGKARPLLVGCRRGGCGFCRVQVTSGQYRTDKMSVAHVTEDAAAQGYALACCLYPDSDLTLRSAVEVKTRPGSKSAQTTQT